MRTKSEKKDVITSASVGSATTGVLPIDRTTGVVAEPRQGLTVKPLLNSVKKPKK